MHRSTNQIKQTNKKILVLVIGLFALVGLDFIPTFVQDANKRSLEDSSVDSQLPAQSEQKLKILTLGGSVTWGAAIKNRNKAYPFLIGHDYGHYVHNLAIRGTGSYYPAQCISSMLKGDYIHHAKGNNPEYDPESVTFDVVILEYSVNGMHGFELLYKRLKERFPDALFIYIDLWSFRSGKFDSTYVMKLVRDSGDYVYQFPNKGDPVSEFDYQTIMNKNATVEDYPMWKTETLFASDNHHLSPTGHALVAEQVMDIIHTYFKAVPNPHLGSWLGGDTCRSWYDSGWMPPNPAVVEGGELRKWDVEKGKWAIEVAKEGLILEYDHDDDKEASLNLQFMTKCKNAWDHYTSKYPPVIIAVRQSMDDILDAKALANSDKVQIGRTEYERIGKISKGWTFVSPIHKKHPNYHITEIKHAGNLVKGKNFVFVYPLHDEKKDKNVVYPFRLTATILCEACKQLGWSSDIW